mmetsp:Transcript_35291/g.93082  ORF Transcript_35291/g.93082 Transcript_35291/m.93082 type:complete len:469 (-) Transcript_35291:72-1478(-)
MRAERRRCLRPCRFLLPLVFQHVNAVSVNFTQALRAERLHAEALWRSGRGLLWFQHFRRAGGTSLCHLLRAAAPIARFLLARGEACQPEDWKLRDAVAICEQNLTLLSAELRVLEGNAFAQEYGPIPGPVLLGHRALRHGLRDWVFIASMRDPWSRFWSQLRYEMATCLVNAKALALCVSGRFELLGHYWSPTAHPHSVLGVPGAAIAPGPEVYVDNYYTRVLLNRTDVSGPALTKNDLEDAMVLLKERISVVVIAEDFANTALLLACSLGMDLEQARPLLRTRIRPYEAHESLMTDIPQDESDLGLEDVRALRTRFVRKNSFDYALYAHARAIARHRLATCTRKRPDIDIVRRTMPEEDLTATTTTTTVELTIDDLFGCTGGFLEVTEKGEYFLKCPRNAMQHATSWWSSLGAEGEPKRKLGQPIPGKDCWKNGFTWATCCAPSFGPRGNTKCWDHDFTHERCCVSE